MGQMRPNEAFDFESALTSTPDVSLHRANRRDGPIAEIGRPLSLAPGANFRLRIFGSYERDAMSGKIQLLSKNASVGLYRRNFDKKLCGTHV
jgi:hypothetical protein